MAATYIENNPLKQPDVQEWLSLPVDERILRRYEQIMQVGPADRVSWAAKLDMVSNIDGQDVRLLFPRKRGLSKQIVYADIGGAASIPDKTVLEDILKDLPTGFADERVQFSESSYCLNGYVIESPEDGGVDVRVHGFVDPMSQAKFEVLVEPHIDYEKEMRREIGEEIDGDEWYEVVERIQAHSTDLSPGWETIPHDFADYLLQAKFSVLPARPFGGNRISRREKFITHTMMSQGSVRIDKAMMAGLLETGRSQFVSGDERNIITPFPAFTLENLNRINYQEAVMQQRESVISPYMFQGVSPVEISTAVYNY